MNDPDKSEEERQKRFLKTDKEIDRFSLKIKELRILLSNWLDRDIEPKFSNAMENFEPIPKN